MTYINSKQCTVIKSAKVQKFKVLICEFDKFIDFFIFKYFDLISFQPLLAQRVDGITRQSGGPSDENSSPVCRSK
jgi:hypothetical protein